MKKELSITEAIEELNRETHLNDVVKKVSSIWVFGDISDAHFSSPERLQEDEDNPTPDELYLNLSDTQLLQLTDDELHQITNVELLDRLVKLDRTKLTAHQANILRPVYEEKVIIDKQDVIDFLTKLKSCEYLYIANRPKNTEFLHRHHLSSNDCLNIIRQLKVSDYYRNTKDYTLAHIGDNLMIFEPKNVRLHESDDTTTDLVVYIKTDVDETDGDASVMISFHDTDRQNQLPYTED